MNDPTGTQKSLGARGDYADLWKHHTVSYLVTATKEYIVHLDQDGDIDWETSPEYDIDTPKKAEFNLEKHNSVLNDAALLEETPLEGVSLETRNAFKRLIGEAIACALDLDYVGGRKMLISARQFIRARSEEKSRYWYLCASFQGCAPFTLLGILVWLWRDCFASVIGTDAVWLFLCSISGAVGALFSVITRAGQLRFDGSAGQLLHQLEGWSRIAAGSIAGIIAGLAVKSEIIFAALTHNNQLHSVMLLAGLAAGSSERFAPSIITKFDAAHPKINDDSVDTVNSEK